MSLKLFDHDFTEAQFLLNTAMASRQHLGQGLDKSGQALARLGVGTERYPRWRAWLDHLTPGERRRLIEQIVELVMLDAPGPRYAGDRAWHRPRSGPPIETAIAALNRAEQIDPQAPSALYAERARYYAALGRDERAKVDRGRAPRSSRRRATI